MNYESLEEYQKFSEQTIHDLSMQITELEQKLAIFTNLLEISKYINQYMQDPNLFPLINDMLIGIFGAKYSTIYIKDKGTYTAVTPPEFSYSNRDLEVALIYHHNEQRFIINQETPIYPNPPKGQEIYSCLGVPITINDRILGFILIQHGEKNYFSSEHSTFLYSVANHVGVAIENNLLYNQIKESANRDGLTEIFNKTYFFNTLDMITDLKEQNYSIVMIDIDDFKKVNDTYGHLYGDIVLKKIANILQQSVRPKDIVARYGGEELIIYFDHFTNREKVLARVECIRETIQNKIIKGDGFSSSVTASFGIYAKDNNDFLSLREVIQKADDNLYYSKRHGKNQCCINEKEDAKL